MSHLQLSEHILRYGANVRDFFHTAQRATLISPLFNVPGRLVLGSYCYHEHLPELLRKAQGVLEPEEIGLRMKGVGMRPNYVALNALMLGYFNGREQHRLRAGQRPGEVLEDERREDVATVVDFWHRVASVYVEGDAYLPMDTGYQLPVLPPTEVAALCESLVAPAAEERIAIRRAIAVIELYTFILNGEARVGVFNHGPYPLAGGDVLLVKEVVGLQDDFLPWKLDVRPPIDQVVRVMQLRDVQASIDLFGSLFVTPFEYEDHIVAEAVLTRSGGTLTRLDVDRLQAVQDVAADAQVAMYAQAHAWTPDYQIAYGADLYASLALGFARLAGLDLDRDVREAFHATADRCVPGLLGGEDPMLILQQLGATDGHLYSPALPD